MLDDSAYPLEEEWSKAERKKRKAKCDNPKGFTMKASKRKLSPVIAIQINSESQNPVTLYIKGNAKNIGSVGITYQNVYQA